MAAKKKNGESGSLVRRATIALRQDVLNRADGAFLGSESDLVLRFGVSRPTFRQAAKLVEQEQLLIIKRGVGGGFFARQPTTQAVAHVAAVYLMAREATMEDAVRAARPLFADSARFAARRRDRASGARLSAFLAQESDLGGASDDLRGFLKSERDFLEIFSSLSSNSVLQLYTMVLVDFAATFVASSVYSGHPDRITAYRSHRRGLIQAVLRGDEEVAELMSHRRSDAIIAWMEEDMGTGRIPAKGSLAKQSKHANRKLIGLIPDSLSRKNEGGGATYEPYGQCA